MQNSFRFFSPFFMDNQKHLKMKLQTALKVVNATCVLGAENKIEDEINTNGWVFYAANTRRSEGHFVKHQKATYDDQQINGDLNIGTGRIEPKKRDWYFHIDQNASNGRELLFYTYNKTNYDPLSDPQFRITRAQNELLVSALLCQELRGGTCHLRANLIAKYLWEHPEGIHRIEVVRSSDFEHAFVIVNREGVLHKPETWGNAFVVDAWYGEQNQGVVYSAAEFPNMIKKVKRFVETQYTLLKTMGLSSPVAVSTGYSDSTVCVLACEIKPQVQAYPTYSKRPFKPLEDYYGIDVYPKEPAHPKTYFKNELNRDFLLHQSKMKNSFREIALKCARDELEERLQYRSRPR